MCVGFFALENSEYALVLCSNRDEYLARPSTEAHFHSFGGQDQNANQSQPHGNVLSGRDVRAGGTWFGINKSGHVALLTNITEPAQTTYTSSRGHLASSFLLSDSESPSRPLEDVLDKIVPPDAKFPGFNLLLLAPSSSASKQGERLSFDAVWVTNDGAGGAVTTRPLSDEERHCGGISNGIDGQGATEWPKVKHGVHSLCNLMEQSLSRSHTEAGVVDHLFDILAWESSDPPHEGSQLCNTIQVKPLLLETTQGPELYGTRVSTVLLITRNGKVHFVERDICRLTQDGKVVKADPRSQRVFRFQLAPSKS